MATAAKSVAKAEKQAEKELLRAADASRRLEKRLEKEAAAKVAAAAKTLAKAEKKAEIESLRAADTSRKAVKRAAKILCPIKGSYFRINQLRRELCVVSPVWGFGHAYSLLFFSYLSIVLATYRLKLKT